MYMLIWLQQHQQHKTLNEIIGKKQKNANYKSCIIILGWFYTSDIGREYAGK